MAFRRTFVFVSALALMFLVMASQLDAQSITQGNVRGTVTDPSGAVVPGATVILKSTTTGSTQSRTTNSSGFYEFALVTPGSYTLTITAPGYQSATQSVAASLGQVTSSNVKLSVASAATTVEVTAEGSVIHPNPEVSTTLSESQIEYVPNGAGDLSYIAQTAPGASMNTQAGYGNFSTFGLGGTTNNFTVNSAPENDPFLSLNNSGATNVLLGQNDVAEATVVNNGYSGQYFSSGANVNYITKSGSNNFHGNAAWLWNGRWLNANGYFNKQNSPPTPRGFVNDNQWAGSFGGPIVKNKAFFFADTEGLYLLIPVSRKINLPTAAYENATLANVAVTQPSEVSFYQNMFRLWNGAPGAANAVNSLPNGGCRDFVAAGAPGVALGFGTANPCALRLNSTVKGATHEWLITGRYDQNLSNNDKMYIHYRTDHGVQATYTDPLNPIFNVTSNQPQDEGQLQWAHTVGSNIVNSFTMNVSHYSAIFVQPNLPATLAVQPIEVSFTGAALRDMGHDYNIFPQGRNVTQYGFVDDLSWTAGKNSLKFGANFGRWDISDHDPGLGSVPAVVGESMTDFFNGVGTLYTQSFPNRLSQPVALWNLGFYGEDRLRLRSNLDLTFTLRTDYNSNPVCQTNCFNRLPGNFLNIDHSLATPYNQSVLSHLHQALPGSYHPWTLEPRFGFSYSPMTNTVISGGFGLFSSIIPAVYTDSLMNNLPNDPAFILPGVPYGPTAPGNGQGISAASSAALKTGFPAGATWASLNAQLLGLTGGTSGFSPPNFFNAARGIHVPRTQEWNLQVQQGFGNKTALKLQYVGNHGIWQQIWNAGLNSYCSDIVAPTTLLSAPGTPSCLSSLGAPAGLTTFTGLPALPLDQRFLQISEASTGYNSNYNGLVVSFLRRLSAFQFQLNYTWSHALDFVSNGGQQLPFNFNTNSSISNPQNPFNVRQNMYGNADYDVRNNFSANYVYTSPRMKGLLGVLGDWTIGGTLFWHGGLPFTVVDTGTGSTLNAYGYGGTQVGAAGLATFADQTGGGSGISCGSQFAKLNAPPCPGLANNFTPDVFSFGNQRRNQVRGPQYFDTDLSVLKNFHLPVLSEAASVSFGVTFFNLFNHPNFDQPVGDVADPSFGTIVSTINSPTSIYGSFLNADASPRLIQTQIRLTF
jgi:hypothetical protein